MYSIELNTEKLSKLAYIEKVNMGKILYTKIISIIDAKEFGNFFISSENVAYWFFTSFCGTDCKDLHNEHQYYNDITTKDLTYSCFYNEWLTNNHQKMKNLLKKFLEELTDKERDYFDFFSKLILSLKQI